MLLAFLVYGCSRPQRVVQHWITKNLKLNSSAAKRAPCKIAMTDTILAVSAKFTIDRTKWGMTYGKGRVNDEVDISVPLVFAC